MQHEQYTPDVICRSMGLPGFVEPGRPAPTLRALLKPSFHPEVCVTLAGGDKPRIEVVALVEMLWVQPSPRLLPSCREQAAVAVADSQTAFVNARDAVIEARTRDPCCYADGMGIAVWLLAAQGSEEFAGHAARPIATRFAKGLIPLAWASCHDARVRNALADCACYVDLQLPYDPIPPVPVLSRIAVLGTEEDRADLRRRLERLTERTPDA